MALILNTQFNKFAKYTSNHLTIKIQNVSPTLKSSLCPSSDGPQDPSPRQLLMRCASFLYRLVAFSRISVCGIVQYVDFSFYLRYCKVLKKCYKLLI